LYLVGHDVLVDRCVFRDFDNSKDTSLLYIIGSATSSYEVGTNEFSSINGLLASLGGIKCKADEVYEITKTIFRNITSE